MRTRDGLTAVLLLGALVAACKSDHATAPPDGCGTTLAFTVLPVPLATISAATPVGNMGPPVHTIPTDHVGLYLNQAGIPLLAPGPLRVTGISRTRYIVSPFRQGLSDFSITANTCGGYVLSFGHIASLVGALASQVGGSCQTYSTANESVESCENRGANVSLAAGEAIGTVGTSASGGPTAGGAFDMGLYASSNRNFYVNPSRVSSKTLTAVCPYDPFPADVRSALIGKIGDVNAGIREEPACGSMSVDVAATAQGLWTLQSAPANQTGDETNFAVLAPHPLFPQSGQTFSIGVASVSGAQSSAPVKYPRATNGRVNRQFADVTADGLLYCYVSSLAAARYSHFVRLAPGNVLTLQRVIHLPGASPCAADASTWLLNNTAVAFIR